MGNPIKTTGKIYMNFEIDADTAYKTLLADCVKHGCIKENDETSKTMTTKLGIIGKRYGKVFGDDKKERTIPVYGYFDTEKKEYYVTSDEIIKGLFTVFTSYSLKYIHSDEKLGIYEDLWSQNIACEDKVLYKGKAAHELFQAMEYVRDNFENFLKIGKKPVTRPEMVDAILIKVNCDLNAPGPGPHYLGFNILTTEEEKEDMENFLLEIINKYNIPYHFGMEIGPMGKRASSKLPSKEEIEKAMAEGAEYIRRDGEISRSRRNG